MSIPMSRAMMQELKSQKDEEARQRNIKRIVDEIYTEAINLASTTTESSYNHEIPSSNMTMINPCDRRAMKKNYLDQIKQYELRNELQRNRNQSYYQGAPDPFHIKNMSHILAGLRELFPECAVTHTLLSQAKDGKMYDIAKLDDAVLAFIDRTLDQSFIIIDWS
jgi:hypothetical protein